MNHDPNLRKATATNGSADSNGHGIGGIDNVSFHCGNCGCRLLSPLRLIGKSMRCPLCSSSSVVVEQPRDYGLAVTTLRAAVLSRQAAAGAGAGCMSPTDFRIGKLLGEGRYAKVYLGKQKSVGRRVAIKIMRSEDANPSRFLRFGMEAEVLRRLSHPNILHAFGCGFQENCCWMVLEYMDGGTVADRSRGPVPWTVASHWLRQALCGLAAAHQAGIVHRDIKPENLLLTRHGRLCIGDFGFIKVFGCDMNATRLGASVGTVAYMAPEQITRGGSDFLSDIYGMGVAFYRVLTGHLPFLAENLGDTIKLIVEGAAEPIGVSAPSVPAAFRRIIEKMMQKRPLLRYRTAQEVHADVKALPSA